MLFRLVILLCGFLMLSACVTSSPEEFFKIPEVPQGEGARTGQYPKIGEVPQGQTQQITPAEVASTKVQLGQDVQKGNEQAARDNDAAYRAEVEALRRLAEQQKQQRQAEIESRQF